MIPASYMFKDIYHQHWEEDATIRKTPQQVRFPNGLTTPVQLLAKAMLHRNGKPGRQYFGVHAYD